MPVAPPPCINDAAEPTTDAGPRGFKSPETHPSKLRAGRSAATGPAAELESLGKPERTISALTRQQAPKFCGQGMGSALMVVAVAAAARAPGGKRTGYCA